MEQPTDIHNGQQEPSLKLKTARTLKWNSINKVAEQVLYAVTGIVLANILSHEDFGLVGVILVFQSFASLFVDSGFANALVQRKNPTTLDYSTVFWFNLGVSAIIYAMLWFAAPLIDTVFHAGGRLVPLSRVMFLTFILNGTALVQTNRLTKQMNVRLVALSNVMGLVVSGIVGVWLALDGWGAWAIVWQSVTLAAVKSLVLWTSTHWHPTMQFSMASLRSIFKVGAGVMSSNLLNVASQNIYSFIVGLFYNLAQLGCYTQADKWSKMGVSSLSQILTVTFLPVLSTVQDEIERLHRMISKINRLSAYIMMPCMAFMILAAPHIFHVLFAHKWDNAILLFQLLALRGIFTILTAVSNNYVLAVGDARRLVYSEAVRDAIMVAAIAVTVPFGITWLVVGQVASGVICYAYSVWLAQRATGYGAWSTVSENARFAAVAAVAAAVAALLQLLTDNAWILLPAQALLGLAVYLGINAVAGAEVQREALNYIFGRLRRGGK